MKLTAKYNQNSNTITLYFPEEFDSAVVIGDGTITATQIANNAITTDKILADAVTQLKIAAGAISDTELAALAVTAAKIALGVITFEHITTDPTKTIITDNLRDALVTTAKINALAVDNTKLAELTIEAGKLKLGAPFLTGDVWTSNDPSAGYIAWDAHNFVYSGVSYAILAGNTNKKYVYFDGTTTYATSDTNPTLTNSQFLIATNNAGAPDLAWMGVCRIPTAAIGTAAIAGLAVATAKIADLAVIEAKIGNLAVGKGKK